MFCISYTLGKSCQNCNGLYITNDIEQIVEDVFQIVKHAVDPSKSKNDQNIIDLFTALFGNDRSRHLIARKLFQTVADSVYTKDYTVVCNNPMVQLTPSNHDPQGIWKYSTLD